MITDTELKIKAEEILIANLGLVETERFISLIQRDPFDYSLWSQKLFETQSLEEIISNAEKLSSPLDISKPKTYLERAESFFINGELEASANFLRKELENTIKTFLRKKQVILAEKESRSVQDLINKLSVHTQNEKVKQILREEIIPFVKNLLHRGSQANSEPIYRDSNERGLGRCVLELSRSIDPSCLRAPVIHLRWGFALVRKVSK